MISKNEVKYIQSLSDKKNRDRDNVFVAEGPKLVSELLNNGFLPRIIYTTNQQSDYNIKAQVTEVEPSELQRLSSFETANEVIGIFPQPKPPQLSFENKVTLVLDGIRDPGNLGTIIRTADWFGITQIVASPDSADCYNAKVVQSTMGSISRVSIYYESLPSILTTTKVRMIGAKLNGKTLDKTEPLTEGILVIGNESKGIRPDLPSFLSETVTIPRIGGAESLNAAVATGILLSHLVKL